MSEGRRRVVVTGLGIVSPLGNNVAETWLGLAAGRSGIGPVTTFDTSGLVSRIAGEVRGFNPAQYVTNRKTLKVLSRSDGFGMGAAGMAWQDAGMPGVKFDPYRAGIYLACGKEPAPGEGLGDAVLASVDRNGEFGHRLMGEVGASLVSPLYFLEGLPVTALFYLSEQYRIFGPNASLVGTGDASAQAIGQAMRAIKRGDIDQALAGGFDCACDWWNLSKYGSLGATSQRNDDPASACRPFDRTRDGTVLGEGAAIVVMEERSQALGRGAQIYGELVGYGAGCDAFDVVQPEPEGRGLVVALQAALADAGLTPEEIDSIAAHGSGTVLGDKSETTAIKRVFGKHAYRMPVSAIKSMIGDLGAAAGAMEFAAALLALRHGLLPPTINYRHPDASCDLDYVPNEARKVDLHVALAIGRGQAGQNAVLVVKKPD